MEQADRLTDLIANSGRYANDPSEVRRMSDPDRESNIRRMEYVANTANRYVGNISRRFGNADYLSNENYNRRVGQNVYMRGAMGSAK